VLVELRRQLKSPSAAARSDRLREPLAVSLAQVDDQQDLTQSGDILGTLRYMAPEQFHGKGSSQSDVYSLGVTLYELLALRPVFSNSNRGALIHEILREPATPLRSVDPTIPRDLATIVHKAIERDPRHRYASAQDMADDLLRFLSDEPIRARRLSAWRSLGSRSAITRQMNSNASPNRMPPPHWI
jgi:serine/threonine protein kinase